MGRPKDHEFWKYVERLDVVDGSVKHKSLNVNPKSLNVKRKSLKCTFCGMVFKGPPSISRIKAHLAKILGKGIQPCEKVPSDVEAAAKEAIQGRNKQHKTMPSSSINELSNPISRPQNQNLDNMSIGEFPVNMKDHDMEQPVGEGRICSPTQVANQTENDAGAGQSVQPFEARGYELPATELTDKELEMRLKKMESWLMDDNVEASAEEAIQGRNEKNKAMPSSSINDVPNPISWQQNQEISEEEIFEEGEGEISLLDQVANQTESNAGVGQSMQLVESRGGISSLDSVANQTEINAGAGQSNPISWQQNLETSIVEYYSQGEGEIPLLNQVANQTENNAGAGRSMQLVESRGGISSLDSVANQTEIDAGAGQSNPISWQKNQEMPVEEIFGQMEIDDVNFEEKNQAPKSKFEQLESNEADIIIEAENAESQPGKKRKNEVENWLVNVGMINNEVHSSEQEVEESRLEGLLEEKVEKMTKGLVLDAYETDDEALLASELEGLEFQTNKDKLLECLMKEEIFIIGIYGMGGAGKTTLVTHIHNELCQRPNTFHYVFWITVSQDFSIYNLQERIAKAIGFDLTNEDDERKRAAKLSKALKKRQKFVIILDDLWNHFHLEEVGIPVRVNGCKLILTTRSSDVCCRMSCQEKIHVNPLSGEEAWRLFQSKLGGSLSPDVIEIAKSIVKECAGLPLGIVTMAGSMRGVDDICEWRNALRELKESKFREDDMKNKVFQVLKFSYNRLTDSALQQCFLYYALYPEDFRIERKELINNLISEGIIEEMESRQAEFDRGHSILNRLEKVCLLEGVEDSLKRRRVKMHDLVRDMAVQIMTSNPRAMVQAGRQLTKMPDEEEWTKDLVRCSLMDNHIKEIPFGYSPRCPKLTTLFLGDNPWLRSISDSFFVKLKGVKVLDLSYSGISELPSSISYLVNLSALLLRCCERLSHIPSLAKLGALKRLDLNFCYIVEEVPQGIELLSNLRYLDLQGTSIEEFPPGILPKLSNLQFLKVEFTVKAEEVALLRRLETLVCHFDDIAEFDAYSTSITWSNLSKYHLEVGSSDYPYDKPQGKKSVSFYGGDEYGILFLPKNVEALEFLSCHIETNGLCLENATELKSLRIEICDGMECLLSLSSSPCIFQSLEEITIRDLEDLQFLFSRETTSIPSSPPHATFSLLKQFHISDCPSMKKLFPPDLLPNLQNLEYIYVGDCENMVELIGAQEEEEEEEEVHESSANIQFALPKLKSIELRALTELKSICRGKMICNSLQNIVFVNCRQLKQIPLSLVLTDSGQPIRLPSLQKMEICPREWWESEAVELDHPNAKDLLSPLCHLLESV